MKKIEAYLNLKGFSVLKCVMSMKSVLFVVMLCLCSFTALGQYIIKGKVVDKDDGLPLPQVSVFITGTQIGVPTDMNGEFTLRVASDTITLTVRQVGYLTQVITPDFKNLNLIILKVDCIRDHFKSPNIVAYGSFDSKNKSHGGRLDLRLPYAIDINLNTSHSFYNLENSQSIYRGELAYDDIIHGCDLELHLAYSFQSYKLHSEGIDFNSSLLSSTWQFKSTFWKVGIGIGQNRLLDSPNNLIGYQMGFNRWFSLSDKVNIPFSISTTRWKGFSEYQASIAQSFGPFNMRLEYNRIKNFSQINLLLGFYIRLRKLTEYEIKARAKKRQSRKDKRTEKPN